MVIFCNWIFCFHVALFILAGEPFITIEAHTAEADDELSFETGVIIDVLHKHLDGWWVGR